MARLSVCLWSTLFPFPFFLQIQIRILKVSTNYVMLLSGSSYKLRIAGLRFLGCALKSQVSSACFCLRALNKTAHMLFPTYVINNINIYKVSVPNKDEVIKYGIKKTVLQERGLSRMRLLYMHLHKGPKENTLPKSKRFDFKSA